MKFYEIDAGIELATNELVDEDGVINEEALQRLKELEAAEEEKTEGCLLAWKGFTAEAEAVRNEEKTLAERRRALERKAEGMKAFLQARLAGEKFKTARVSVSYRKTTSCEVDEGAWLFWPEEVQDKLTKQVVTVDKNEVKKALKNGEELEGARLIESQSMIIK